MRRGKSFFSPGNGASFRPATTSTKYRRGRSILALWLRDAFPSSVRSCQALTFYPALAYGLDNNRLSRVNFSGVRNRGPSGIVYRIKVACGRSKHSRHNTGGGQVGKIADPKLHARKITGQTPVSNEQSRAMNSSQLGLCKWFILKIARLHKEIADKISLLFPMAAPCGLRPSQYSLENCVRFQQARFSVAQPKRGHEPWKH